MNVALIKGLDKDQKLDIQTEYVRSFLLRRRLSEVLEGKIASRVSSMSDRESFSEDGWAYKNAYDLGYIKAMKEVINIIFDKNENKM